MQQIYNVDRFRFSIFDPKIFYLEIFHSLFQFCFSPLLYLFFFFFFFFSVFHGDATLPIDWWKSQEFWSVICSAGCWCFFPLLFVFRFFFSFYLFIFFYLFFLFFFFFFEIPYTVFECFRDEDRMCTSEILKTDLLSILQFCAHRPTGIYTRELFWKKEENTRYPTYVFTYVFPYIYFHSWLIRNSNSLHTHLNNI